MDDRASKLLAEFEKEIADAEVRRKTAIAEADSLEARNKQTIADIEAKAKARAEELDGENNKKLEVFNSQIKDLQVVKTDLQDDISNLNERKQVLDQTIEELEDKKAIINTELSTAADKLANIDEQITTAKAEITDHRGKIGSLLEEIRDLDAAKNKLAEERDLLETEVSNLEVTTIETDAEAKTRKDQLDKQLASAEEKLNIALANLTETSNKDEAMRKNWADEHARLDKRTAVVRKMEAKLSDAEARVAELDNYSKL